MKTKMAWQHPAKHTGPQRPERDMHFSHADVTATAETSVVNFIGFHPTKSHL